LDVDGVVFRGDGQLPVAQVPDHPVAERNDTPEADAHSAAGRHQDTGVLSGVENGCGSSSLDDNPVLEKTHRAPFGLGDHG